ncbi:MAG: VWA containing CoxE family protein, partial [Myxococcota bacterium]
MFLDFFFLLRRRGIAVGVTEWMTLMEALGAGLASESLLDFYAVCRAVCVKNEGQFDLYDQCFAEHFRGAPA